MRRMWRSRLQNRSEALALDANAVCAGLALACSYSSSDEYEAEIIQVRRAAGAYGPRHQHRAFAAFVAAAAAFVVALLII